MEEIILLKGVTKAYKGTEVLKNVSVSFEKAKIHGITGRNGSGKTVLIKTICGLIRPDRGSVVVNGKTIGKDVDFPPNIGAVIESPGFLPTISAYKNLSYLASLRNVIGREKIREAIALVGLDPDSRKPVGKYSLGMKQRLGFAQAVMEDPDILLLDEPMNGLDQNGVLEMRDFLFQFKAVGKTILIVSHNAGDIETLCDTVHQMEQGVLH